MDRRQLAIVATAIAVLLVAVAAAVLALPDGYRPGWLHSTPAAAYPAAAECAACHPDTVREWQTSAHARSADNPLVHASVCGRCHTPVGTMLDPEYQNKLSEGQPPAELPAAAAEGVTCVVCHAPTVLPDEPLLTFEPVWPNWRVTDLALRILPFTTAVGTFGGRGEQDPAPVPNDFHESTFDAALGASERCRACHAVVVDKGPLAGQLGAPQPRVALDTTFDEWSASPYAGLGTSCQGCHMPRQATDGPAAVAPPGVNFPAPPPPRARFDHSFPGAATAYWQNGPQVATQEQQAAAWLARAATVRLLVPPSARPQQALRIGVRIENVGAGHDLPSGFAFWRELWLEVVAKDADDRLVFASGLLDEDGWLPDEFNPRVRADPRQYDPFLLELRARLVRGQGDLAPWLQPDRTVLVPASAVPRNLNGTPILSTDAYDVGPIVERVAALAGGMERSSTLVEEVYVLRYAEAVIRNGIPARGSRLAHYTIPTGDAGRGPLHITARLLSRSLARAMTSQQEEIRDAPPLRPVYVMAVAEATVHLE